MVLDEGTAESQEQAVAICNSYWEDAMNEKYVEIKKTEPEHQVVKAVVYVAGEIDSDGETMTADEVRKAAWGFLEKRKEKNIDLQHDWKESGCYVIESYVTEEETKDFPKDAWVMAVKCTDEVWGKIKSGLLNGFSFGGVAKTSTRRVLAEVAKEIIGDTEENLNKDIIPAHKHQFLLHLDRDGNIVRGKTDVVEGHYHKISYGTATDKELDHSHLISLREDQE